MNNLFNIMQDIGKLVNYYQIKTEITYKLISINDYNGLEKIFKEYDYDMVFHAGAYKHVNLLENNIYSAYRNNICGSYNLIKLSKKFKIKKIYFYFN